MIVVICISAQSAQANDKSKIAEALAYSGCVRNIDSKQFKMDAIVNSAISLGLQYKILDEGSNSDFLEQNDTPVGRMNHKHIVQSWTTAGLLDAKWKSLESSYEKGLNAGMKRWNSGSTLGVSTMAARSVAGSKLTALCRAAEIFVTAQAKKAKIPLRQYIVRVSGEYLPPLP